MLITNWLKSVPQRLKKRTYHRRLNQQRQVATAVDILEDRALLAVTGTFLGGDLTINQDSAGESLAVAIGTDGAGNVQINDGNGNDITAAIGLATNIDASNVLRLFVNGNQGDDVVILGNIPTEPLNPNAPAGTFANPPNGGVTTLDPLGVIIPTDLYDGLTEIVVDTGNGNDIVIGSATFGSTLLGGDGNDFITGGSADDSILAGDGNDTIAGIGGNNTLAGGDGLDTIFGGGLADTITGGDSDDFIEAFGGNDSIDGGNGQDSILGGAGDDTITGGFGEDTIEGQDGADLIFGSENNDILNGGGGNDTITGNDDDDTIGGGGGVDSLLGANGNDLIGSFLPGITINDVRVVEGNPGDSSQLVFTVTMFGQLGQPVTVDFSTADGTATAGVDYTPTSGTLTFPVSVGAQTETILVDITEDFNIEADETLFINLSNATGGVVILDNQGRGTIVDDDREAGIVIFDQQVNEDTGLLEFTVALTSARNNLVTVDFNITDGTATGGDITPPPVPPDDGSVDFADGGGTVFFAPGETVKTISIPVLADTAVEADETLIATLTNSFGAPIIRSVATGTIYNDDTTSIFIDDLVIESEGDVGNSIATFTVGLTAFSDFDITFDFGTQSGNNVDPFRNAISSVDFVATTGTVFLPAGTISDSVQVAIPIIGETTDEFDESFFVNLLNDLILTGATPFQNFANPQDLISISDNQAVGTIEDDDDPPTISINDAVFTSEGNAGDSGVLNFTVSLSEVSGVPISVDVFSSEDTADDSTDFDPVPLTPLNFAPGELTKTVQVTINGDTLDEPNETFFLNLTNATTTTPSDPFIADNQGLGTIIDDDGVATLTLVNPGNVSEGAGTQTFDVMLSPVSGQTVTVNYTTTNGTATAPADFIAQTGTLTFLPGDTMETISVSIVDDLVDEPAQTFSVVLSGAVNAVLANTTVTISIIDNDPPLTLAPEFDDASPDDESPFEQNDPVTSPTPESDDETPVVNAASEFDITLHYSGAVTESQRAAIEAAAAAWETVIVGDLPDVYHETYGLIDDVVIEVGSAYIDGTGGTLAVAGPSALRPNSFLPAIGAITLDTGDLDFLEANDLLTTVLTHEMAHVLGFGTIWDDLGLLSESVASGGSDPRFTGEYATAEFNRLFNVNEIGVPVENLGSSGGTADTHWRELVFDAEIMTAFLDTQVVNPISTVTIAQFADLGFQVDLNGAEAGGVIGDVAVSGPIDGGSLVTSANMVSSNVDIVDLGDWMQGDAGNDTIIGADGQDTIFGGLADDTLFGGNGADQIAGGDGDDSIVGTILIPADVFALNFLNDAVQDDNAINALPNRDPAAPFNGGAFGPWNGDQLFGENGNDTIRGSDAPDRLDGGFGNDWLFAEGGDDILNGAWGNDTLEGRDGNDLFFGGSGNDTLVAGTLIPANPTANPNFSTAPRNYLTDVIAGSDSDTIRGQTGEDLVLGDEGADMLFGDEMNDTILGNGGDDSMTGGQGDDSIDGGTGNDSLIWNVGDDADTIDGGTGFDRQMINGDGTNETFDIAAVGSFLGVDRNGNDIIDVSKSPNSVEAFEINAGSGNDTFNIADLNGIPVLLTMNGENGGDTFNAAGSDTTQAVLVYDGGNGNDIMDGGTGDELFIGGAGDDSINGNGGRDTIQGGDGNDTLSGGAGRDSIEGGGNDDSINGGDGNDTLKGDAGQDTIMGDLGNDFVLGGDNDDSLLGNDGDDSLFGEDGNDQLFGGANADLLDGGVDNDSLEGGTGRDTLLGGLNDDILLGQGGDDSLLGGDGDDSISGGEFSELNAPPVAVPGSGNDTILGGDGDDRLAGGDGDDALSGGNGSDFINGSFGNDTLLGGDNNDALIGGGGDDILLGGDGNDFITGNGGSDTVAGNQGNDNIKDAPGEIDESFTFFADWVDEL